MFKRAIAGIGLCAGLLVALPSPASAHTVSIHYGGGYGTVTPHSVVWASDPACNQARRVNVQFYQSSVGGVTWHRLNAPCGDIASTNRSPQRVTRFRVCEVGTGCSAWKTVT